MRALEKEPGQRFQNADAFIAALDAALKDPRRAAAARPPSRRCRRSSPTPEEADGRAEEEERRRRRRLLDPGRRAAVLIGLLVGFALTRDTTTEVPT